MIFDMNKYEKQQNTIRNDTKRLNENKLNTKRYFKARQII